MADNIAITAGTGTTMGTDQVGTVHYPYAKIVDGTTDSENKLIVNSSGEALVKVNPALPAGANYIGLASVNIGGTLPAGTNAIGKLATNSGVDIGDVDVTSLPALVAGTAYIGLASVNIGGSLPALTTGANYIGLVTTIPASNVTLNPSGAYIGLASVNIGGSLPALSAGANYIGLASVNIGGSLPALAAGANYIGLASVNIGGSLPALSAGANYIGLASVNIGGTLPALAAGTNFIGLASITGDINIKGSGKTWNIAPFAVNATGNATLFVPTNKFYIMNLLLGAASTVGIMIKSGATYIAGNATIGVPLAAQGGWVENNSPVAPLYIGLANAAAFVLETTTAAPIAGRVTWYEE